MKSRKIIVVLFAVIIAAVMITTISVPGAKASSEGTATDLLGFDADALPEGYEEPGGIEDTPYGKDNVIIAPVSELFTVDQFGMGSLTGHNDNKIGSFLNNYTSQGYSTSRSAAGDFDGDGKDESVAIAALKPDILSGLDLLITDPLTGATTYQHLAYGPCGMGTIGENLANYQNNTFAYKLQNYLSIAAGDFDGDGTDEIAVLVPIAPAHVEIWDKDTVNDVWYRSKSMNLMSLTDGAVNMVDLLAADINGDGVEDLSFSQNLYNRTLTYYYQPTEDFSISDSYINVYYGAKENALGTSEQVVCKKSDDDTAMITRLALDFGDVDNDGKSELVAAGQNERDETTRWFALYEYDHDTNCLEMIQDTLITIGEYDLEWGENIYNYHYFSTAGCIANLACLKIVGGKEYIYCDSILYEYTPGGFAMNKRFEGTSFTAGDIADGAGGAWWGAAGVKYTDVDSDGGNYYFHEWGAIAADFDGDGVETIYTEQYFWKDVYVDRLSSIYNEKNGDSLVLDYPVYRLTQINPLDVTSGTAIEEGDNYFTWVWPYIDWDFLGFMYHNFNFTAPNTDNDSMVLQYKGYNFTYSSPIVMAVLASPPYFSDLEHLDGGDTYVYNSETSFGKTEGTATSTTETYAVSVGGMVGFEHDFTIFGCPVASVDIEAEYQHDWTWETEQAESVEYSLTYTTFGGQDSVVLYSIPTDVFTYDAWTPNEDGTDWVWSEMVVQIPYQPVTSVVERSSYDSIAAQYPDILPVIGGNILQHTIGQPGTYPMSTAGLDDVLTGSEWSGVAGGAGAAITQAIDITTENTDTTGYNNTWMLTVGGSILDVKASISAGGEAGGGESVTETNGTTFETTVVNMPQEGQDAGYRYSWKLLKYSHGGVQDFPVVTYLVSDVSQPPILPASITARGISTSEIQLNWEESMNLNGTVDDTVSSYSIYRYYDTSISPGYRLIAEIPSFSSGKYAYDEATGYYTANDGAYIFTYDAGSVTYGYINSGLSPYSLYEYKIKVTRDLPVHLESVLSDACTARTYSNIGNINITGPMDPTVFPDQDAAALSINVELDLQEGTTAGETMYQWQQRTLAYRDQDGNWIIPDESDWNDISNGTSSSLIITNPAACASQEYRCVVDVEVSPSGGGSQWIGAISDAAVLNFSKRTPTLLLTVTNTGTDSPEVSLEAVVDKGTGIAAPTGIVGFTLTNDNSYSKTVTALVDADSKAVVTGLLLPSEGIYYVTAVYGGDTVYNSAADDEEFVAVSSGSSDFYWIEADSSAEYGSTLNPAVWKYVQGGDPIEITVVAFTVQDTSGWVSGSTITAQAAGSYTLTADFIDEVPETLTKRFTVTPKPVTVTAPTASAEQGAASLPGTDTLVFDPALIPGDTPDSLGLSVQCLNSQGQTVTMDNTTPAGVYTTSIAINPAFAPAQANYDFEFINGSYTVVGQRFAVTVSADGNGNVEITNPSGPYETVEGVDKYIDGTAITVTATPANGYSVTRWEANGVIVDPNTLTDSNIFTWTVAGSDLTITAIFSIEENYLTLEAEHGTIENNTFIQSGDAVATDAEIQFTAVSDSGWHFKEWRQTVSASTTVFNGNPLLFTMPDSSCTLTAVFERDSYTLTLGEHLTAEANGEDIPSGGQVMGDSEITVTAAPGYTITKWFVNGVEDLSSPVPSVYSFTITADTDITVETERQTFIVVYDTADGGGTITATADGVEFASGDPVGGGAAVIITVVPDDCYSFDSWAIHGAASDDCTTSGEVLTCTALSGDLTATAFLVPPSTVIVTSGAHGSVTAEINGDSAEIDADGTLLVPYGGSLTLSAYPDSGFMVESWSTNDNPFYTTAKTWSIARVTADTAIHAEFTSIAFYPVTYSVADDSTADGNLTAEADGTSFASGDELGGGSELEFTAEPAANSMVSSWTVIVRDEEQSEYREHTDNVLHIPALSGKTDVKVCFEPLDAYTVEGVVYGEGGQFSAISFDPDLIDGKVRSGGSVTFQVSPDTDYSLETLTRIDDDGEANETDQADNDGIYVLRNVTSDTLIIVTFSEEESSGGGGGGGGGPLPIIHTVPASSDSKTVKVPYTLEDEIAALKLDDSTMKKLLKYSDKTGITIDMSDVDDCSSIEFELDGKWLTDNEKILALTVIGLGEVTISRDMLKNFGVQEDSTIHVVIKLGSIKISLEMDDRVIAGKDPLNPVRVLYPFDHSMSIITIIYDTKTGRVLPFSLTDGQGNMKFLTPYFSTFDAKDNPKTFSDIGEHWAKDYIGFTTARELFLGTGPAEFSPDISMTRAMFVTVLGRLLGIEAADYPGTSFSDAVPGQWYSAYVQWAAANQIVEGYGDGLFGPDDPITREQMAAIILRFAEYANIDLKVGSDVTVFDDNDNISHWAAFYVSNAQRSGLIHGRENNRFDPQATSTRAEVATILQRFIENVLQ